jgi:hypothetical protein
MQFPSNSNSIHEFTFANNSTRLSSSSLFLLWMMIFSAEQNLVIGMPGFDHHGIRAAQFVAVYNISSKIESILMILVSN